MCDLVKLASRRSACTFQFASLKSIAMERLLIEKDRRDAGPTNQSIPTVLGISMRDRLDRRLAGRSNSKPIPVVIPCRRLAPYSFALTT